MSQGLSAVEARNLKASGLASPLPSYFWGSPSPAFTSVSTALEPIPSSLPVSSFRPRSPITWTTPAASRPKWKLTFSSPFQTLLDISQRHPTSVCSVSLCRLGSGAPSSRPLTAICWKAGVINPRIYDVWVVMAPPRVVRVQCPETRHLKA